MTPMIAITLVGAGQAVIFAGAVAGASAMLVRTPPVRWCARTVRWCARILVLDPLTARARLFIGAVVDERLDARPLTNGAGWQTVQALDERVRAIADHLGVEISSDPPDQQE